ncbi:hypothetical protein GCM10011533_18450 [Streptosporangium jomthongense]|uniref:DUF4124 domain-containing protein n=1 Tax=Marinobacter aromaticivorans TaxID=1494078 RepID=A0ABW2IVK8_9GAMM|nr:DUF4124 domain-containing protein [Marinobacter aromaticivorans]GGE66488.1 hypothetical protein GCM10011533_18450 [Streptosporangium jomthongense]
MMIKWLVRLSFPALGLLLLLMFFGLNVPAPVSEPVAEETEPEIPAFEGLVPSPIPTEGPEIVFKWQDTDGNWHYADQPPEHGPWNTLAIERPDKNQSPARLSNPETDWQSPYRAPFSLGPSAGRNGS